MDQTSGVQPATSEKRFKAWRSWLGGCAILGVLMVFLWWWMGQKSIGTITTPLSGTDTAPVIPNLTLYQGKYFTFSYPDDFESRLDGQAVNFPLLERALLSRNDVEGQKIAVVVQDTAGYSLEEYASYRLREIDTKAYLKEKVEIQGQNYTVFTKDSTVFEAGAFWMIDNRVMSIVLSSPIQATGLRSELLSLLESLQMVGK
jgi:hypothetical protein